MVKTIETFVPRDEKSLIEGFLRKKENLKELRRACTRGEKSLIVHFDKFLEHDLKLAKSLIDNPDEFLRTADKILEDITKLPGARLRVRGLDRTLEIQELRAEHVDNFVQVSGAVTGVNETRFLKREGDVDRPDLEEFEDYQIIRIGPLVVELTADLVGKAQKGDTVIITGTLKAVPTGIPAALIPSKRALFDKLLVANHIEKEKAESGKQEG